MGIIGIIGLIGSGKGSVADFLKDQKGYKKMSFADPVKDATAGIFGWDRKLLQGDTEESREWREKTDKFWSDVLGYKFSPRLALQLVGTEVGRNYFHPDIWLESFRLRYSTSDTNNVVVDDCRFSNEIECILSLGGKIVLIERGERPAWFDDAYNFNEGIKDSPRMDVKHKSVHPSEWSWISKRTFDVATVIRNDGNMEELHSQIKNLLT